MASQLRGLCLSNQRSSLASSKRIVFRDSLCVPGISAACANSQRFGTLNRVDASLGRSHFLSWSRAVDSTGTGADRAGSSAVRTTTHRAWSVRAAPGVRVAAFPGSRAISSSAGTAASRRDASVACNSGSRGANDARPATCRAITGAGASSSGSAVIAPSQPTCPAQRPGHDPAPGPARRARPRRLRGIHRAPARRPRAPSCG